jgi:hypothetical protein
MSDEVTVAVLREIRDEARQTNERLGHVEAVFAERLGRVEAVLIDLAEQQRFVVRWLAASTDRDRRLEQEVDALKARVDAIEEHLPSKG